MGIVGAMTLGTWLQTLGNAAISLSVDYMAEAIKAVAIAGKAPAGVVVSRGQTSYELAQEAEEGSSCINEGGDGFGDIGMTEGGDSNEDESTVLFEGPEQRVLL